MKVTAKIKCPGCAFTTILPFSRPTALKPAVITFDCETCGSTVNAQIKRAKGTGITYRVHMIKPSPLLMEMLIEESQHNAEVGTYPEEQSNGQA